MNKELPEENKNTIDEINESGDKSEYMEFLTSIKNKFISPTLNEINSQENNSSLNIMLNQLAYYKYKKSDNIEKNIKNLSISSHINLVYIYLEKQLVEISYIADKEKRDAKIAKIYDWFKNNLKYEKDIKTITYKTYK